MAAALMETPLGSVASSGGGGGGGDGDGESNIARLLLKLRVRESTAMVVQDSCAVH